MPDAGKMQLKWIWVDTPRKLEGARREILESFMLGIDTEYDSFRYFRDKLCLVQIKTRKKVHVFDPLSELDLSFLGEAFASTAKLKIFHAGENDIRLLKRDYGFEFNNLFDTQKAASLLGCAHLALAVIIREFLEIQLEKSKKIQRSRWDIRPLTNEQLTYAVADAAHLIDLYRILERDLKAKGLERVALQSSAGIADSSWQERILDPRGHEKIRGFSFLSARQQRRMRDLYRWRFQKAQETNRAVFMVLSDQHLLELSCMSLPSLEVLVGKAILLPDRARLYGQEILQVLRGRPDE